MRKFLKGALVYLPTGVKVYQLTDSHAVVRYKTVSKPSNVLYIGNRDDKYCRVLYEGESWYVPTGDVYPSRRCENEH